jgi:hypothetical protein
MLRAMGWGKIRFAAQSLLLSAFLSVGAAAQSDFCALQLEPPPLYDHPAFDVEREYMSIADVNANCPRSSSADLLDSVILGCTICHFDDCTEYLPTAGEDGLSAEDVACVTRHEDGHVNAERETGDPDSNHFGWM